MYESEEEKRLKDQLAECNPFEMESPEEFEASRQLLRALDRAERERRERMSQEEKESEFSRRVGGYSDKLYDRFGEDGTFDGYESLIELRMTQYDFDWRERTDQEKLELFDRAARDVSRHLDYNLNSYLTGQVREHFKNHHDIEED